MQIKSFGDFIFNIYVNSYHVSDSTLDTEFGQTHGR